MNDISEQLEQMAKHQFIPVSFVLLSDYQTEFSSLFNALGKVLAEGLSAEKVGKPNINDLAELSINVNIKEDKTKSKVFSL